MCLPIKENEILFPCKSSQRFLIFTISPQVTYKQEYVAYAASLMPTKKQKQNPFELWSRQPALVSFHLVVLRRCPQSGEGVNLLLCVLAELPGDFSGLRQLLRQVGLNVFWQLIIREDV